MKVLPFVLFLAIAVNTASSQWRGGIKIDRPPDLPSSSTRKGTRPQGGRPFNTFNNNRRPPPPPRQKDFFDYNYFQQRKEPFIPAELHPPILERPKPKAGGRNRPRSRPAKGPKPWRKNKNGPTPPTTEMGTSFFTSTTDYFTTTTAYIPPSTPPTTAQKTMPPTTTAPTTTTSTAAPTTKAPTTMVPKIKIVTASNPIPYKPHVQYKPDTKTPGGIQTSDPIFPSPNTPAQIKSEVNNTQYTVAGQQQMKNKSPEPIVTQHMFGTNKIPRPPPLQYQQPALPNSPRRTQSTDTTRGQQQQIIAGHPPLQQQPAVPPNSPRSSLSTETTRVQQQQVHVGQPPLQQQPAVLQNSPRSSLSTETTRVQQQQIVAGQPPIQQQSAVLQNSPHSSLSTETTRVQQQQVHVGQPPLQQQPTVLQNSSQRSLSTESIRLQQEIYAGQPPLQQPPPKGMVDFTPYNPQRNPPTEINVRSQQTIENARNPFKYPRQFVPRSKPIFKMPRGSFKRPSDVPSEIKPQVISKLSPGSVLVDPMPANGLESDSKSVISSQSHFINTNSQRPPEPASEPRFPSQTKSDAAYSVDSANTNSLGIKSRTPLSQNTYVPPKSLKQTLVGHLSTRLVDPTSNRRIKQEIVSAPDMPINRISSNNYPVKDSSLQLGSSVGNNERPNTRATNLLGKPAMVQLPFGVSEAPSKEQIIAPRNVASSGMSGINKSVMPETSQFGTGKSLQDLISQQKQLRYDPALDLVKQGKGIPIQSEGKNMWQQSNNVPAFNAVNLDKGLSTESRISPEQQPPTYVAPSETVNSGMDISMQGGLERKWQQPRYVSAAKSVLLGKDIAVQSGVSTELQQPSAILALDTIKSGKAASMQSGIKPPQLINMPAAKSPISIAMPSVSANQEQSPGYVPASFTVNSDRDYSAESGLLSKLYSRLHPISDLANFDMSKSIKSGYYTQQEQSNYEPAAYTVSSGVGQSMQKETKTQLQEPKYVPAAKSVDFGTGLSMQKATNSQQQQPRYVHAAKSVDFGTGLSMQKAANSQMEFTNSPASSQNGIKSQPKLPSYLTVSDTAPGGSNLQHESSNMPTVNQLELAIGKQISSSDPSISDNRKSVQSVNNTPLQPPTYIHTTNKLGPMVGSTKPPALMARNIQSSELSQTGTMIGTTLPPYEPSRTTQSSTKSTTSIYISEQTKPSAMSNSNTKLSRVQKVGNLMLKAFNDFMSKYKGASSSASGSSAGSQASAKTGGTTENNQTRSTSGSELLTGAGNSNQNTNTGTNTSGTRDGFKPSDPNVRSNTVSNNKGTVRQGSFNSVHSSTGSAIETTFSRSEPPQNTYKKQGSAGINNSTNEQAQTSSTNNQYLTNTDLSGRASTNNNQIADVSNEQSNRGNIAGRVFFGNNVTAVTPSINTNMVQKPDTAYQAQTTNNGETKVVSGPPPPSFKRGKPNTVGTSGQSKAIDLNRRNKRPVDFHLPASAHPAVLERPTAVGNSQPGNQVIQGSANIGQPPTSQIAQDSYNQHQNQHQTVGGRLGPAPCKMAPVCGSDGFTYMSNCFVWTGLTIACEGYCPCANQGTQSSMVQPSQQAAFTEPAPYNAGSGVQTQQEPCSACPATYSPVCTTTGATYDNDCLRRCSGEVAACNGECPCRSSATSGQPCESYCQATYAPVCSVLDHTYDNDCFRHCSGEAISCDGECPCPTAVAPQGVVAKETAPSYNGNFNNEPSNQPLSTCECLPGDIDPVCTTSGETVWYGCEAICLGKEIACSSECPC